MANPVSSIFTKPVFRGGLGTTDAKQRAVGGFSEIFGGIVAKEMRTAMIGDDAMGDSASSDIVGGLFDQAMGHALSKSKAMKPINDLLDRELNGMEPHHANGAAVAPVHGSGALRVAALNYRSSGRIAAPRTELTPKRVSSSETSVSIPDGSRGPTLLPPPPTDMAPVLSPPSSVEG